MKVKASELKAGDLIDLHGDKYADPKSDRIEFESEYALVESVEIETENCVALYIEGVDCFGFPPNHLIERV